MCISVIWGGALVNQNKLDQAEETYREKLTLARKLFGNNNNPKVQHAIVTLAECLSQKGDDAEVAKLYEEAADGGSIGAQHSLGNMHASGQGVPQNDVEAVKWYRKAAESGDESAQFDLGWMYANARGVAKDEAEAVRWYRKAAERHLSQALIELAQIYVEGRGVPKDESEALKWIAVATKDAENGDAYAAERLGWWYANGPARLQNETEALKWFRKAADQGFAEAQANLARMYAAGKGVAKDETEAVKWYRKAAEQGLGLAQVNLGGMYAAGRGVAKDLAEAVKWVRKAGEQRDSEALNQAAWALATSPVPELRDGTNAVKLAEKAVAATSRTIPNYLDTLAAAYAETGQFDKAVEIQKEAIAKNQDTSLGAELALHLKFYESKTPFHQAAAGNSNAASPPPAGEQGQRPN